MKKNPTQFRQRFQRWKNGEQVYDAGLPKYEEGKEPEDPIAYDTYMPEVVVNPNQPLHFSGHTYSEAWNQDLKDRYYSGQNVRNARSAAVPYLMDALTLPWTLERAIAAPSRIKSIGSMVRHPMQTGRAIKTAWKNLRTLKINTDPEDIRLAADWNGINKYKTTIVTRSKIAVDYANKHRHTGETLNQALDRLADEVATEGGIHNHKYPPDIRQMISHFTLPSVKTFQKGFVGSTLLATPFAKQNNATISVNY